jgi:hypothetical protein
MWHETHNGNWCARLPGRTVIVFRRQRTDQWCVCCRVGGKTAYHRGKFPHKDAAFQTACRLFRIAPPPADDVDRDLAALKDRILARTRR